MGGRFGTFLGIVLLVAASYGLYLVKWEVRELKRQNTSVRAEMLQQQEAIRVLETEWAYLNRPQRLHELAKEYLQLEVVNGLQLADVEALDLQAIPAAADDDGLLPGAMLSSARGY